MVRLTFIISMSVDIGIITLLEECEMNQYDTQYNQLISRISNEGVWDKDQDVRTKWEDGTPAYTKSVISAQLTFDNTEVPILTTKKCGWKTPIQEMLTFWQKKMHTMKVMHDAGVTIWDEWEITEGEWAGTIGPSYGYQLAQQWRKVPNTTIVNELIVSGYLNNPLIEDREYVLLDQVDYLLYQLKVNPSSRRHVTSLWGVEYLDNMALNPCVWSTQWLVKENKLHLIVQIRSNDLALGNPYNVFQYYVLQRMFAQVTGYELGSLTFNINDAHYYERHEEELLEQITRPTHELPTLWINPEITNFYDFTIDDFRLENYTSGEKIKYEVAI